MYKPPKKTLAELQANAKLLTQQIINGAHLDASAMQLLTKQLASVKSQITESEKEAKNV